MSGLIVATILFLTVILVLVFGVGASYLAANAVFSMMGHNDSKPAAPPLKPAAAAGSD